MNSSQHDRSRRELRDWGRGDSETNRLLSVVYHKISCILGELHGLYEHLEPYYCHDNGRPGTDPVVLIKMVLIQHLFGIPSLRQTYQRIQDTLSYRRFLGYGLLDEIPHFATVSYAFCKRFPEELTQEIFEHILNKALNSRMVDPSVIFIDGTHIKASANKKKFHNNSQIYYVCHEYRKHYFAA